MIFSIRAENGPCRGMRENGTGKTIKRGKENIWFVATSEGKFWFSKRSGFGKVDYERTALHYSGKMMSEGGPGSASKDGVGINRPGVIGTIQAAKGENSKQTE